MKPGKRDQNNAPAEHQATFLAHALALAALHGPGPWPQDGYPLPDEPPRHDHGDKTSLPSVVLDGVRTHGFGIDPDPATARGVADTIETTALEPHTPTPASLARLHDLLARRSALDLADDLLTELRARGLPRRRLHDLARHLTEHGTARNTVKLGIALLGECGDENDRELLLLLGTLEELTLYAVVALVKTQPDRQRAAYELARRVDGWGRIHAVERLKGTTDPEIKAWLLRDGFRNGVMNEYLAHTAATTGDLYTALLEPEIDDALLDGAGAILTALALGGPAEDMTHYDDAVPAMHRYAELAGAAEPTLSMLDSLLTIKRCALTRDSGITWPDDEPQRLTHRYETLLAKPSWRELTLAHLGEPHDASTPDKFGTALSCAGRLGIPAIPQVLRHLERHPFDAYAWQWAAAHADGETITAVITQATRLLPLETLASGPGKSGGFGHEHTPDRALGALINHLDGHPGEGTELLRIALSSRVIWIRRRALQVLTDWPPNAQPRRLRDWIITAAEVEPDGDLKSKMQAFLENGTTP